VDLLLDSTEFFPIDSHLNVS